MSLIDVLGEYAFIAKLDVSNLKMSADFYENVLGLVHDPRFDTDKWMQFNVPNINQVAVGLWESDNVGTGGSVPTFVVTDIQAAGNYLTEQGIAVSPIQDVGEGVFMAFFDDPDGNTLGLRQNSPNQPNPAEIGA